MKPGKTLEQHIAVFGESGSGKTVLLSSFYGAAQEPGYTKANLFNVVAENPSQHTHLMQNYLGMKRSDKVPAPNRFSATTYSFLVKLKDRAKDKAKGKGKAKQRRAKRADALRLVWHDYPGEWFEQEVSGPEEAMRRAETFRSLLGSDVALLLVDGQRLRDHAGEEARYLKSLLADFRSGLLRLKDELLPDGKPLVRFPRIWVLALSKADLLPDLDVYGFRDLLLEQAGDDLDALREVLAGLVESGDALSVGEDVLLLSSAKFEAGTIEVTQRVGLDLILPLAAILPFARHVRWADAGRASRAVAMELMGGAAAVASALGLAGGTAAGLIGRKNKALGTVGLLLSQFGPGLDDAAQAANEKLRDADNGAQSRQGRLTATLMRFQKDLEQGEADRVLLRSLR